MNPHRNDAYAYATPTFPYPVPNVKKGKRKEQIHNHNLSPTQLLKATTFWTNSRQLLHDLSQHRNAVARMKI